MNKDEWKRFVGKINNTVNYYEDTGRVWGPLGRFAWKFRNRNDNGPFRKIVEEAEEEKEQWQPVKIGLFKGDYGRFVEVANGFVDLMNELSWLEILANDFRTTFH